MMAAKAQRRAFDTRIGLIDIGNLRRLDWVLLLLVLALATVGFLALYSATQDTSGGEPLGLFRGIRRALSGDFGKQVLFLVIGMIVALLITCTDYRFLVSIGPLMYLLALGALALVLVYGKEIKGARRWFDLGFLSLQPSEPAKLALIYMLAWYFSRLGTRIRKIRYFLLTFAILGAPCILIALQPGLSSALSYGPIMMVMLFAAGCRLWHVGALTLAGLVLSVAVGFQVANYQNMVERIKEEIPKGPRQTTAIEEGWEAVHYPLGLKLEQHQVSRLATFIEADPDPRGTGYQPLQARISVGSGQLKGKGFCRVTKTQLSFLPESRTDFIFALLAEEWGFIGCVAILALYLAFLFRTLALARMCTEPSGSLLAIGCATLFAFHAIVNIGITIGLLPVTGMPLPFISYGGSFYVTAMACVGTLMSVYARRRFFE